MNHPPTPAQPTTDDRATMDVMSEDASPVFLVGATRSGTTLLRIMLDHHPQFTNVGEFEYAVSCIVDGNFPKMQDYYRYLDLERMYRVRSWTIDPKYDYARLVRSFLQQAADRAGKPHVGATVHSKFDELLKIWPQARFIHLIRDPRDVARSCIGMGWSGNVWHGTKYWLDPVRRWSRLTNLLGEDRQLQVRYEELIRSPQRVLSQICDFIGIAYDDAMLRYQDSTAYEAPDTACVDQWRRKLSPREIQIIESRCHPLMEKYGYQPVSTQLAAPSKLRRASLVADHRCRRVWKNIRVYGVPRYMLWQAAKSMPYCAFKRRIISSKNRYDQARLK